MKNPYFFCQQLSYSERVTNPYVVEEIVNCWSPEEGRGNKEVEMFCGLSGWLRGKPREDIKTIKNGGGKKFESSHCSKVFFFNKKKVSEISMRLESVLHIETKCNDLISIHCLVSGVEFVYLQGTKVTQKMRCYISVFFLLDLTLDWTRESLVDGFP